MEVEIKSLDSDTREIVLHGQDSTIFNMLRHKLLEYKAISLAGFKKKHPLLDKVSLVVKSNRAPKKRVLYSMKKLEEEWKDLEIK